MKFASSIFSAILFGVILNGCASISPETVSVLPVVESLSVAEHSVEPETAESPVDLPAPFRPTKQQPSAVLAAPNPRQALLARKDTAEPATIYLGSFRTPSRSSAGSAEILSSVLPLPSWNPESVLTPASSQEVVAEILSEAVVSSPSESSTGLPVPALPDSAPLRMAEDTRSAAATTAPTPAVEIAAPVAARSSQAPVRQSPATPPASPAVPAANPAVPRAAAPAATEEVAATVAEPAGAEAAIRAQEDEREFVHGTRGLPVEIEVPGFGWEVSSLALDTGEVLRSTQIAAAGFDIVPRYQPTSMVFRVQSQPADAEGFRISFRRTSLQSGQREDRDVFVQLNDAGTRLRSADQNTTPRDSAAQEVALQSVAEPDVQARHTEESTEPDRALFLAAGDAARTRTSAGIRQALGLYRQLIAAYPLSDFYYDAAARIRELERQYVMVR